MSVHRSRSSLPSRRAVLRGAGVALALPWLESLVRPARAQSLAPPKRFVAIYLPNGAPEYWTPPLAGIGPNWQLSSVLEPLQDLKTKVTVVSGLENGSAFNASGSPSVEPSHGRQSGAWLTCVDAAVVRKAHGLDGASVQVNGVSADQIMAQSPAFMGKTPLPSVQIGLSSVLSYCDGTQCANSRSVSWGTETTPLYKEVDPLLVFNLLTGVTPPDTTVPPPRLAARQSVLDAVQETAGAVRARLSGSDKHRLDEFLDSVRKVEQSVSLPVFSCGTLPNKPNFPPVSGSSYRQNVGEYDKSVHFDLMNDLLAWALQCDQTRIASFMLEDERSEFVYDFVPKRTFDPLTSQPAEGFCPEWHGGGQSGSQDDFASIVHWHVGKVAELCRKLAAMPELDGTSVLDNTVIFMGACMHGSNHSCADLPALLVGGGGGRLRTDRHLSLGKRPMRDLYFTLMNGVYDVGVNDFGANATGAPIAMINALL